MVEKIQKIPAHLARCWRVVSFTKQATAAHVAQKRKVPIQRLYGTLIAHSQSLCKLLLLKYAVALPHQLLYRILIMKDEKPGLIQMAGNGNPPPNPKKQEPMKQGMKYPKKK